MCRIVKSVEKESRLVVAGDWGVGGLGVGSVVGE